MTEEQAMSERLFDFIDKALQRYFGPEYGSCPRMRRADVERLLSDDTRRRVAQARIAAVEWGNTEIIGNVVITSDRLVITPYGLLYAAGMNGWVWGEFPRPMPRLFHEPGDTAGARLPGLPASARRPLYYLATPPGLFEPIVGRVDATPLQQGSAAAVDNRFGHELTFPWPLDAVLRRMLDAHQVLRLDLSEDNDAVRLKPGQYLHSIGS